MPKVSSSSWLTPDKKVVLIQPWDSDPRQYKVSCVITDRPEILRELAIAAKEAADELEGNNEAHT